MSGWIYSIPKERRLAHIRARNMKAGKTLAIHTDEEWAANKEDREKPFNIQNLLNVYDPSLVLNNDASWPYEEYNARWDRD